MSMKKLLVLAALGTVLVAPAFAQQGPNAGQHRRSTVPPGGIYYYEHHHNAHPVSRLDGERSKTNHRKSEHARHHHHPAVQR
jgi:hypothetical protein